MAKIYYPKFKTVADGSLRVTKVEIADTDQFADGVPVVDGEPPAATSITAEGLMPPAKADDKPEASSVYYSPEGDILKW